MKPKKLKVIQNFTESTAKSDVCTVLVVCNEIRLYGYMYSIGRFKYHGLEKNLNNYVSK